MTSHYPPLPTSQMLFRLLVIIALSTVAPLSLAQEQSVVDQIVQQKYTDDLPEIKKRKRIRALVTYSRTDFFFDDSGAPIGLQVEFMHEFEKQLNKGVKREADKVRVQFIPTTFDRLIPDLLEGRGDIAAAILTLTDERQKKIKFITSNRQKIAELVVTHKSVDNITAVEDLAGQELYVLRGSSYAEHLRALNKTFKKNKLKPIKITEADSTQTSEDILELVNAGVVKMTVVDDYKAQIWARVLPNIKLLNSVAISKNNAAGWGIRKSSPELEKSLNVFLNKVKKGTLFGNISSGNTVISTNSISSPLLPRPIKSLNWTTVGRVIVVQRELCSCCLLPLQINMSASLTSILRKTIFMQARNTWHFCVIAIFPIRRSPRKTAWHFHGRPITLAPPRSGR
jgi:ABC-type amino acid transport substrate-binding protein